MLLKEIHHRVKNNLQVISSLLKLQAENIADTAAKEIFRDSQARVRSIALLHEKLYQSSHLDRIEMDGYVRELTSGLLRTYGSAASMIDVDVDAHGVSLCSDVAVPCGLILNELVTNAFKHAFVNSPGRGHVTVRMERHESEVRLAVSDDGTALAHPT